MQYELIPSSLTHNVYAEDTESISGTLEQAQQLARVIMDTDKTFSEVEIKECNFIETIYR